MRFRNSTRDIPTSGLRDEATIAPTRSSLPGMSDEAFAADVVLVERDLASLKRLLEAR